MSDGIGTKEIAHEDGFEMPADELDEAVEDAIVEEEDAAEAEKAAEDAQEDAADRLEMEVEADLDLEGRPEVDTEMLDAFLERSGVLVPESEEALPDEETEA